MKSENVLHTYTEAAYAFVHAADWLDDTDAPMITSLVKLAEQLDNSSRISAATQAEFTKAHLRLSKKAPVTVKEEPDELEKFLAEVASLK